MDKATIREQARHHLKTMTISEVDYERVVDRFFSHFHFDKDQVIAGYWPMKKTREFDVRYLLDELHKKGFTVALPCVQKKNKVLKFKQWKPDQELKKGAFDVLEPKGLKTIKPDVFLCPLLAFDRKGNRMGQGGGYYDATLSYYRGQKDITAIGVGYGTQAVLFNLPVEEHDQQMDYILTPDQIIDCGV